jgi:hypothetical protein
MKTKTLAEWLQWERENDSVPVARCSECHRGYLWIAKNGGACLACGSPVWLLPKAPPE